MPQTLPIRDLGAAGVVTDIEPSSMPVQVFTRGKNVRFNDGGVVRGPVFRKVRSDLLTHDDTLPSGVTLQPTTPAFIPKHVACVSTASGYNTIYIISKNFQFKTYINNTLTYIISSQAGNGASDTPFCSTQLADHLYINRKDTRPIVTSTTTVAPSMLANFESTNGAQDWRCSSLRAYGDFLIAMNMSEGSSDYHTRVRFSDLTAAGQIPGSWDASDPTTSAGFIDLVDMGTPIVDGLPLGNKFIIYSNDETYMMDFVGGTFIMNTRKLFDDAGIVNLNCVVEAERKHFVMSADDIYVHDGVTKKSIVDSRIRKYVFNSIDTGNLTSCFVHHNESTNEVYFCYKSLDDMAEYTAGDGCNRAAVYNYNNDTWSFMDLPNVVSSTQGNISSSTTYQNAVGSYAVFGGSYASQTSGFDQHALFVGLQNTTDGISESKLYGLDDVELGTLSFPLDLEANKEAFIERVGIDLDQLAPISGYKVITGMLPQLSTPNSNKNFSFAFGASDFMSNPPTYETTITFDAATKYRLDSRAAGRYLSYKMTVSDYKDFSFTAFDAEVHVTGRR